ncbi:unnamed protein product, partial [Prorocentrum cordatum]
DSGAQSLAVLHVPRESAGEVGRKAARIAEATGASLEHTGSVLRIGGSEEQQQRAERYARAVISKSLQCDKHPDLTAVSVSREWVEEWRGRDANVEEAHGVLIIFEEAPEANLKKRVRFTVGQMVEAARDDEGVLQMAVVKATEIDRRISLKWCFDAVVQEVDVDRVRLAPRLGIFGDAEARLKAEVVVMTSLDRSAAGTMAARLDSLAPAGDGAGLQWADVELKFKGGLKDTFLLMQGFDLETLLPSATGCHSVCFFQCPVWQIGVGAVGAVRGNTSRPCALVLGEREQREHALLTINFLVSTIENRLSDVLPEQLYSCSSVVSVPQTMREFFFQRTVVDDCSNLKKVMKATGTVIGQLTQVEARKRSAHQGGNDEALEAVYSELRGGTQVRLAIVGQPRSRLAARIRIMALIEDRHNSFHQRPPSGCLEDATDGLAVDQVWLPEDLEHRPSLKQGAVLAGASGALVESAGTLVLLAGTREERRRAQDRSTSRA